MYKIKGTNVEGSRDRMRALKKDENKKSPVCQEPGPSSQVRRERLAKVGGESRGVPLQWQWNASEVLRGN